MEKLIITTIENLVHLKHSIPAGSTWTVAGIGPAHLVMNTHAVLCYGSHITSSHRPRRSRNRQAKRSVRKPVE